MYKETQPVGGRAETQPRWFDAGVFRDGTANRTESHLGVEGPRFLMWVLTWVLPQAGLINLIATLERGPFWEK